MQNLDKFNYILNLYPFVKTQAKRTDQDFIKQRIFEHELMSRQRNAVAFCKNLTGVKGVNLSKIGNEEKEEIEKCLVENFLKHDANYFGERDTIFLDLYHYD
jgi:hypothetical protein